MSDAATETIHDDLDAAVLEAYGWQDLSAKESNCSGGLRPSVANETAPPLDSNGIDGHRPPLQDTSESELLTRLVALNHERASEEKRGLIRYLRPDYQNPAGSSDGHGPPLQEKLPGTEATSSTASPKHRPSGPPPSPPRSPPSRSSSPPVARTPRRSPPDSARRTPNAPSRSRRFWRRCRG